MDAIVELCPNSIELEEEEDCVEVEACLDREKQRESDKEKKNSHLEREL